MKRMCNFLNDNLEFNILEDLNQTIYGEILIV